MEAKLWGGFSVYALEDLEQVKASGRAKSGEAYDAAWALARWYEGERDYQRVYENLALMARLRRKKTIKQVLLEAECLTQLRQREDARALLNEWLRRHPAEPGLYLAMANCYVPLGGADDAEDETVRLGWLNHLYERDGLQPLAKMDQTRPLALDNLAGSAPVIANASKPKVSVIMPVYQAEKTLPFALRSVLAQSWQELEVIVIDDCSSDDSFSIAKQFAKRDPRVTVLRQHQNQGTYVARNRALERAKGEFITVQDADDWSHPQRIEIQMRHALSASNFVGNIVRRAHVRGDLQFMGSSPFGWSRCSLLMPKKTIQSLGGWDRVRISADTEFIWRAEHSVEHGCIERLQHQVPMVFQLFEGPSLTRSRATSVRTIHHGIRREYREAAEHWHESVKSKRCLALSEDRRPFPAPGLILPRREARIDADLLFIADFNLADDDVDFTLSHVKSAVEMGQTVALFHWRHYHRQATTPLQANVRQMAHENKVRIVAPGEIVRTPSVIVGTPTVLNYAIDLCPQIESDSLVVLVTDALIDGSGQLQNPREIIDNIKRLFGTHGFWIPRSDRLRRLMVADPRYPAPRSEHLVDFCRRG